MEKEEKIFKIKEKEGKNKNTWLKSNNFTLIIGENHA